MRTSDHLEVLPYECDLIMKGGITSGIVYPPAIVEIAEDHRLRSIGGSSAGAIAAVSAAAAELGRQRGHDGFGELGRIPAELAQTDATGRTRLQRLFQAQPGTAPLFELFWVARRQRGRARIVKAVKTLAARRVPTPLVIVLAALVVAAGALIVVQSDPAGYVASGLLAALIVVIGGVVWMAAGAVSLLRRLPQELAANFHGVCNGRTVDGSTDPTLTDWLYATVQRLGGCDVHVPITYGDLRAHGIELVTLTTDVSRGAGEMFPPRDANWAFREDEMRALFPSPVVDQLVERAAYVLLGDDSRAALVAAGLHPLPTADDIPIILGARVSLSFPVLLSAIPLWTLVPESQDGRWVLVAKRSWLSDGGITSNLPVHLFDRPLPTRPTYAINLGGGGHSDRSDCVNVWRPISTGTGRLRNVADIGSTFQLLAAVFDTMQNWSDNSLVHAPGYRDRICTIRLDEGEGGMNLDMSATTIERIAKRGKVAGENLAWIRRGEPPACVDDSEPDEVVRHQWDRHRFTRYRMMLAGLAGYVDDTNTAWTKDGPPGTTYADLARTAVGANWLPYRSKWSDTQRAQTETMLNAMFDVDRAPLKNGAPAGSALGFNPRAMSTDGAA